MPVQHRYGALVRDSGKQEMVSKSRRLSHYYGNTRKHENEIPAAHGGRQETKMEMTFSPLQLFADMNTLGSSHRWFHAYFQADTNIVLGDGFPAHMNAARLRTGT